METTSKPPRRRRHAAMRDERELNDQREGARHERGMKTSQRSRSPRQIRDSRHDPDARRNRPLTRPEPHSSRRRGHSHDRSRDRASRLTPEASRRVPEVEDLIPRYRERHREIEEKPPRRSQSRSPGHDYSSRASPSASKRHRSQGQGTSAWSLHLGSTPGTPHATDVNHRLTNKHDPLNPPHVHDLDLQQSRTRVRDGQTERFSPNWTDLCHGHEADRLHQNTTWLHPDELVHHLARINGRRVLGGLPHGDSFHHDHLKQVGNGDLEKGRPVGVILRGPILTKIWPPETIFVEAITRSITKNHISVMIRIPHHPNTFRTITHLLDHPTHHRVVDGMVISKPYPPQHPQGSSYGPPSGPSSHYHSNTTRSPPYTAPTGPMQQYPQGGSYRGGYRGGGFRGRGRGGFKNSHWNSGLPSRGHHDDLGNERFSNVDDHGNTGPEPMDVQEEVFQSHDELGEDTSQSVKDRANPLTTPNRPPPSGPGGSSGSKFSFAFKPSSKPVVTAPKPEISQKLNAAPRREPQPENRERDRARDQEREPPRSAPTEPASSRPRHERRHPPEGPRVAPRMRKVMKIMKRPKPRPTLPADLVDSESVFFRKPGNESVVGSGTYGKVFKGLNVYTKGMVALKRIRMEGERDGFPVTAIREIKLLQSLRHVNIVNLQEVMVERNDCFMVFEYLSHDLTGLLNHPTFKLETAQKKDLAKQMFEGLDYLHTRGVLHRDIKAANILVSNEGVLKIADFGLARFYAKRHQLDYTNRVITIWYRSPELLLGETKYTAAVDVWSAACVMVEIFDRNAIFPGDGTELSQLEKIYNVMGTPNLKDWPNLIDMAWFELLRPTVKRRNVFAEKYRDKMSPAAFDLLSAMFQYDPAKRPSAEQVLQHAYFTEEAPVARQATELATHNDWHEFESKALRKENDRREREARKLAKENAGRDKEKDKKRINEGTDQRDTKRLQVDTNGGNKPTPAVAPPNSTAEP
ncbi:CMGC CDK CRK7 kinase [Fusarium pseudocircinatum]|uniref:cyclin-dependent kinase n=1 Tax=Fusarium pseudocircinatum TaxID=56676 RepID=A0A8H5KPG7_9HYPO|nr:CMGC CDK CRK7 kinase [Fusarium pseudocircinatum]